MLCVLPPFGCYPPFAAGSAHVLTLVPPRYGLHQVAWGEGTLAQFGGELANAKIKKVTPENITLEDDKEVINPPLADSELDPKPPCFTEVAFPALVRAHRPKACYSSASLLDQRYRDRVLPARAVG